MLPVITEYTRKQAAEFRPTPDYKRQKTVTVEEHNNENLGSLRKTKRYSSAHPLLKWSEKGLVTGRHSAGKYASRQFHAISYSLVFHVCMLQNEATVLKQLTDVLSHLLAANCSVSSITYRDDSCATRIVSDNRHWIGKQNELTNKTQNTMCPAHLTTSTQLLQ